MCIAAVCTGEVGVALVFGTVMGEFKVPGPFTQEGPMDKFCIKESLECAVDGDFVWGILAELFCNLLLSQWFCRTEQRG